MSRRVRGAVLLLLCGVLFGALWASEQRLAGQPASPRPEAANPRPEEPTREYLELQSRAIAQPRGRWIPDHQPVMPQVAAPNR